MRITKLIIIFLLSTSLAYAQYTAKTINILTYSVILAETWEEAFNLETLVGAQEISTIRSWYLKARENDDIDNGFDVNYSSLTPTYWTTDGGTGFAQSNTALPQNIYIRARSADLVLELVYYQ